MTFKKGDIVDLVPETTNRKNGKVVYIACFNATTKGGKICDKKNCNHNPKTHIWVKWDGEPLQYSYLINELKLSGSKDENPEAKNIPPAIAKKIEEVKAVYSDDKPAVDYNLYNGFHKLKQGRDGKIYLVSSINPQEEKKIISEDNIDWKKYNGFK